MHSLQVVAFLAVAAVVAVAAEKVEQVEEDPAVQIEDEVDIVPATSEDSSFQGRQFYGGNLDPWNWMGHTSYSPHFSGGAASWYAPMSVPHNNQYAYPARDDSHDKQWALTNIAINIAAAIIPVALLFQSMPTGFFNSAIRKRSLDQDNMLMDTLEPTQVTRIVSLLKSDLTDRRCQEELFCELSRIGEYEDASYLQKAFYYVSTLVPDFLAAKYNLAHLFRITRSGYCKALQCPSTSILDPPKTVPYPTDADQISEVTTQDRGSKSAQ